MKYTSAQTDSIFSINAMYTAFQARYDSHYSFSGEFHNFREIVIVMDGKLGVTAGSEVYMLKKGQAIIHAPLEFHNLWSEGNTMPEIIIFSFSDRNFPDCSSRILQVSDLSEPVKILEQMQNAFTFESGFNFTGIKDESSISHHLAIKSLEHFILTLIGKSSLNNSSLRTRSAQLFTAAVNILEENISKNLSVAEIAGLCSAGEVNLKKTFSRYSGMGIMTYFNKMKINAAIKMIKEGANINETASALGFANQNYFSTVFKRITGHPPSYYK